MKRLFVSVLVAGICVFAPGNVTAQRYGRAMAVLDHQLAVGEAGFGSSPGAVYLYERGAEGWREAGQLTRSGPEVGDGFGWTVSGSDDIALVSAIRPGVAGGAVYAFVRGVDGWQEAGPLTPTTVGEGLSFGLTSDLNGDVAAIGAYSVRGQNAGEVHLFRNEGGTWVPIGVLNEPGPTGRSLFGSSLTFVGDDLFVSDPLNVENTGRVYIYSDGGNGYELSSELTIADGDGSLFGLSLHSLGGEVLVGAGGVNGQSGGVVAFEQVEGEWVEAGRLQAFDGAQGDQFGTAIMSDSDVLWVGAPGSDGRRGRIYAYERDTDGSWLSAQKLSVPDLKLGAGLGSVLAYGEGVLVSGLPGDDYGAGTVQAFDPVGGTWVAAQSIFPTVEGYEAVVGGQVDCSEGSASLFGCSDIDLVSFVPVADLGGGRGTRVNDVWGWTDPESNHEYAIVGRTDGTSFVDISDPVEPVYVGNLPKTEGSPGSTWRDMKVYEDHVFIVSDGAEHHGMQVFDLARLRDFDGEPQTFDEDAHYDGLYSVHNIVINEETGFAYAVGARGGGETCGGGLHMIDIRDPKTPEFAGCFADAETGRRNTGYSHDAQCVVYQGPDSEHQGREICFGSNETALSIADVTDKDAPVALSMASYPNVGYSHQGWLTEDHTFFYMNDELDELQRVVPSTRTLIWDVTDLDDPILVKEHQSENLASDHNLYIRGNLMYQSNYQSGLRVLDISDYENPEEVAYFDTVPGEDLAGMGGSWSNYPFFESGIVIVTSGNEGLFLVRKRERRPVS